MPRGAAVVEYRGKRGVVFRVKYIDAAGVQVQETLGAERDGWTRKKAEAELRDRLVRVDKKAYQRPQPIKFSEYAQTWFDEGQGRRGWKPQTVAVYRGILGHLNAYFGSLPLGSIRPRDVADFTRHELAEGFSAKSVDLHLNVLFNIFKVAKAEELVDSNPVEGTERPKVKRQLWRILTPQEVPAVAKSFDDPLARLIFLTLILTGVRRFELQGLRWSDVDLLEGVLRVRESKSDEGIRSIALSPTLVRALSEHYRTSAFNGDAERVFCHPDRGSKIDHEWYAGKFQAALAKAGITDRVRPFHDMRHASLTNGAAAGEEALELMTRAGHRSMATTSQYLHLAGTVFPKAAQALEDRLLGATTLYPPEPTSADPTDTKAASEAASGLSDPG